MIKHLEVKTYEYGDVKVTVEINYDRNTISLIEKCDKPHLHDPLFNKNCYLLQKKSYIFINRGLAYMNGWRNVLAAMNYAIDEAEKELTTYIKLKEKEKMEGVEAVLMEASGIVKKRNKNK